MTQPHRRDNKNTSFLRRILSGDAFVILDDPRQGYDKFDMQSSRASVVLPHAGKLPNTESLSTFNQWLQGGQSMHFVCTGMDHDLMVTLPQNHYVVMYVPKGENTSNISSISCFFYRNYGRIEKEQVEVSFL